MIYLGSQAQLFFITFTHYSCCSDSTTVASGLYPLFMANTVVVAPI